MSSGTAFRQKNTACGYSYPRSLSLVLVAKSSPPLKKLSYKTACGYSYPRSLPLVLVTILHFKECFNQFAKLNTLFRFVKLFCVPPCQNHFFQNLRPSFTSNRVLSSPTLFWKRGHLHSSRVVFATCFSSHWSTPNLPIPFFFVLTKQCSIEFEQYYIYKQLHADGKILPEIYRTAMRDFKPCSSELRGIICVVISLSLLWYSETCLTLELFQLEASTERRVQWNPHSARISVAIYYFEIRNQNESCTPPALLEIQITHLSIARNALFCASHVDIGSRSCVEEFRRRNRLEKIGETIVLLREETMHCHWLRHKAFEWVDVQDMAAWHVEHLRLILRYEVGRYGYGASPRVELRGRAGKLAQERRVWAASTK